MTGPPPGWNAVERLGGGRYTELTLCERGGTRAVLKTLRVKRREKRDPDHLKAVFAEEVELTNRFDHPNIVRVIETGDHDGVPWMALEAHPQTLAQACWGRNVPKNAADPWPAARIEALLRDLLSGLAAIHAKGVVHRDIKPQNVLLAADRRAVICDFGHAHDPSASVRLGKGRYGTMPYTAPEQRDQPNAVTPAADIYSLGAIGYLLMTGEKPAFDLAPLSDGGALAEWINRAISGDPADRQQELF